VQVTRLPKFVSPFFFFSTVKSRVFLVEFLPKWDGGLSTTLLQYFNMLIICLLFDILIYKTLLNFNKGCCLENVVQTLCLCSCCTSSHIYFIKISFSRSTNQFKINFSHSEGIIQYTFLQV
jgi:hypothetical protein